MSMRNEFSFLPSKMISLMCEDQTEWRDTKIKTGDVITLLNYIHSSARSHFIKRRAVSHGQKAFITLFKLSGLLQIVKSYFMSSQDFITHFNYKWGAKTRLAWSPGAINTRKVEEGNVSGIVSLRKTTAFYWHTIRLNGDRNRPQEHGGKPVGDIWTNLLMMSLSLVQSGVLVNYRLCVLPSCRSVTWPAHYKCSLLQICLFLTWTGREKKT